MVAPDSPADHAVVARVLAGDVDAYAILVRRYQNRYIRFAIRMTGHRTDAEDALQGAFERAYRHLDRCRDPERFSAWFHRIVVNECRTISMNRARHERRFTSEIPEIHVVDEVLADGLGGVDGLQRALDALPSAQREAVLLRYSEELSYEDMAEATGVGISALKMRVKRGVARLQELLNGVSHA